MNLHNDNMKFNMNFDVPNGYFDSLADNVMANIKFEDGKRKHRKTVIWRSLSVAAVLAVVAFLGLSYMPDDRPSFGDSRSYQDFVAGNYEASFSDYNVMEYLEYNELPYGEPDGNPFSDLVSDYYASPVNIYYFQ